MNNIVSNKSTKNTTRKYLVSVYSAGKITSKNVLNSVSGGGKYSYEVSASSTNINTYSEYPSITQYEIELDKNERANLETFKQNKLFKNKMIISWSLIEE